MADSVCNTEQEKTAKRQARQAKQNQNYLGVLGALAVSFSSLCPEEHF